jgi:hypothetical protein
MGNNLSAYLWGYKNTIAGNKTFELFRKIYQTEDLFCRVDIDGDIDTYKTISNKWNANFSINSIKVGYCGNFDASNHNIGRLGWPKENAFEWLNGIYQACIKTNSTYMIILEEDVFILKPISIIKTNFGAAVVKNNNPIPPIILDFIKLVNGNTQNTTYGCCGGCIINVSDFIVGWDLCKDLLWKYYDTIFTQTKLIGWSDCILQVIIQCGGGDVVVNKKLVEPWMQKEGWISDDWRNYEIVNYLKDLEIIKTL